MAQPYSRLKDGFRFDFGGLRTSCPPESLPPNKYALATNVRGTIEHTVRTRLGQSLLFSTAPTPITDMRALTTLGTDNKPRFFARNRIDQIFLDTGVPVGSMLLGGLGAALIPFRPNASPQPYMYIANGADYQKFSAPDALNVVLQRNVGISEPQVAPEAAPTAQQFTELLAPGGIWTTGGTASAWTAGNRSTDIIVAALPDPAFPATPTRWSLQISSSTEYQIGEILYLQSAFQRITIIEDVIAPLSIAMSVGSIYYFTGSTGRCVIVPTGISAAPGNVTEVGTTQSGVAIPQSQLIAQLRRGALIQIGTETCYIWSVTRGPNNSICIETSTIATHAAGESMIGLPTIVVNGIGDPTEVAAATPVIGDQNNVESFQVAVGIGTLTMGASGVSGTVVARPATFLNGWGPLSHVGAYEMGVDQGFGWGLDGSTTQPYSNPGNAFDGNLATAASVTFAHTHQYAGCIWAFPAIPPQASALTLNINSQVPPAQTKRSAGIWYSLDAGTTWSQIYNQALRSQQWDSIPLPANQDMSKVQVMAFTDSHDDMAHSVFEINVTAAPAAPVIGASTGAYNDDDYIHISVKVDNPLNLTELKLQFDVGDGSFTQNYFYYSVRPSDLVTASGNSATQLGAIQSIMQQGTVFNSATEAGLAISTPTVAGANQWTEVWFAIRELTRVGGDMTKTMANIVGVQILVNGTGTLNVSVSSIAFVGGGQPDNFSSNIDYRYRIRPRDSRTGVVGNPSPETRYGVTVRRQPLLITIPYAPYDAQIDTWDIERYGGTVTSWRRIGSTPAVGLPAGFTDNYFDDAAQAGEPLAFDNFEPWPSIDLPLNTTAVSGSGTELLVSIPGPTNALRWLAGTQVQIGGLNVYTLRSRPTLISGINYLFEFETCAGTVAIGTIVSIPEPILAKQPLPYMWGPDAMGRVFACGDPLRPGTLYYARSNTPDSAPDTHNREITPPSEPLLGGEIVDGLSFVASSKRWWALYPNQGAVANPTDFYNPTQLPIERGLAAPYGHCTDGKQIYYWAEDGFYGTSSGSLTDGDLYNLFPHEGVDGNVVTYNGVSYQPPDYSRTGTFRAVYSSGYIYATYQDASGIYRCLTYDTRLKAWCVDEYSPTVSAMYKPEQPEGTLLSNSAMYDKFLQATIDGRVAIQADLANDLAAPITCKLATLEFDGGDLRAGEQWGDFFVDAIPAAAGAALNMTPMFLGALASPVQTFAIAATRKQLPFSLGGALLTNFLGLMLQWVDDFNAQSVPTELFSWQPSFIPKPETIGDRVTDWDDGGQAGAKWWQGFILSADTSNVAKNLVIRDADTLTTHAFTPTVIHNGESERAYSFNTPFIAHMVRIEGTDAVPWRFFGVRWVAEPTPETAHTWQTQASTHGIRGFMHLRQLSLTYSAIAPVTFQATSYDGTSPAALTLPSTGGVVRKIVLPFSANKGQLYFYAATSSAPFAVYVDKSELLVGRWGREEGYANVPLIGGRGGDKAEV